MTVTPRSPPASSFRRGTAFLSDDPQMPKMTAMSTNAVRVPVTITDKNSPAAKANQSKLIPRARSAKTNAKARGSVSATIEANRSWFEEGAVGSPNPRLESHAVVKPTEATIPTATTNILAFLRLMLLAVSTPITTPKHMRRCVRVSLAQACGGIPRLATACISPGPSSQKASNPAPYSAQRYSLSHGLLFADSSSAAASMVARLTPAKYSNFEALKPSPV